MAINDSLRNHFRNQVRLQGGLAVATDRNAAATEIISATGALTPVGGLTIATGDTLSVVDADGITINSVIVPTVITASHHAQAAAEMVDQSFWICPAGTNWQVVGIDFVHAVAEVTAANLRVQVTKDNGTEAPGAGNNLLTNNTNAGFDCKATANTLQNGTLTATTADLQLTADDRLSVDYEAAATELVGVTITVTLQRIA